MWDFMGSLINDNVMELIVNDILIDISCTVLMFRHCVEDKSFISLLSFDLSIYFLWTRSLI